MKKLYYLLFFVFIVATLSACEEKEQTYTDDYNKLTDYQIEYNNAYLSKRVTASDKGYYFLNGPIIYYMDKDGDQAVVLDGRPDNECLSETNFENCNAYVPIESLDLSLFQFYEDKLYTIELQFTSSNKTESNDPFHSGEYQLVSRKPNGEGKKVHHTFPNAEIRHAAIHRGYIYYTTPDYELDDSNEGGNLGSNFKLLRLPLNKFSSEPELLFGGEGGQITYLIPYGSQVYFDFAPDDPSLLGSEKRYDLNSKKIHDLWESDKDADPIFLNIYKDKLYFNYYKHHKTNDFSHLLEEKYITIHASNLDGSEVHETDIPTAEVASTPYFDENYMYVDPDKWDILDLSEYEGIEIENSGMKVYKDDELIETISFPDDLANNASFYPGDEQYMFIHYTVDEMSYILYLDKREIANGNPTFKLLIETPSPNAVDYSFD